MSVLSVYFDRNSTAYTGTYADRLELKLWFASALNTPTWRVLLMDEGAYVNLNEDSSFLFEVIVTNNYVDTSDPRSSSELLDLLDEIVVEAAAATDVSTTRLYAASNTLPSFATALVPVQNAYDFTTTGTSCICLDGYYNTVCDESDQATAAAAGGFFESILDIIIIVAAVLGGLLFLYCVYAKCKGSDDASSTPRKRVSPASPKNAFPSARPTDVEVDVASDAGSDGELMDVEVVEMPESRVRRGRKV